MRQPIPGIIGPCRQCRALSSFARWQFARSFSLQPWACLSLSLSGYAHPVCGCMLVNMLCCCEHQKVHSGIGRKGQAKGYVTKTFGDQAILAKGKNACLDHFGNFCALGLAMFGICSVHCLVTCSCYYLSNFIAVISLYITWNVMKSPEIKRQTIMLFHPCLGEFNENMENHEHASSFHWIKISNSCHGTVRSCLLLVQRLSVQIAIKAWIIIIIDIIFILFWIWWF